MSPMRERFPVRRRRCSDVPPPAVPTAGRTVMRSPSRPAAKGGSGSRRRPRRSNAGSRDSRSRINKSAPILLLSILLSIAIFPTLLLPPTHANHADLSVDSEFRDTLEEKLVFKVDSPTDVQISPDGSMMLVTSKNGKLWAIRNYQDKNPDLTLVLYIKKLCTNIERGLSGVAFHPNFASNRWIYIYYTYDKYNDCDASGSVNDGPINRLSRLTLSNDDTADLDDEEVFFDTPIMPYGSHNSGNIAFGNDGYLYVSVGDGSGGISKTNGDNILYPQALDMLLGKIIRLTDDNEIPESNPYSQDNPDYDGKSQRCHKTGWSSGGYKYKCQEIYSYGLRNPFRFAMDPNTPLSTTRIFLNDVGRHTWESIRECGDGFAGANYGYPEREGPCKKQEDTDCKPEKKRKDGFIDPVHWFHHDDEDGGAVTGGAFYPNTIGWGESWIDTYLYADYAFGGIYRIKEGNDGCEYPSCDPPVSDYDGSTQVVSGLKRVVSMKFGPYQGQTVLYVATRGDTGNNGDEAIYRIAFAGANNKEPTARIETTTETGGGGGGKLLGFPPLTVTFDGSSSTDPDSQPLSYSWDFDGDGTTDSTSDVDTFTFTEAGTYVATLTVRDPMGGSDATEVRIDVDPSPPRPKINKPKEGTEFSVGDVLKLKGSSSTGMEGDDDDDVTLTWSVRLHHGDHFHQVLEPTNGNGLEVVTPGPPSFEDATDEQIYLVILLTTTDASTGLSSTTSTVLRPKIVTFVLDSEPSGMNVMANGVDFVTPASITTWAKHGFDVKAISQKGSDGATYGFDRWSDGGGKTHRYVAPSSDSSSSSAAAAADGEIPPDADANADSVPKLMLDFKIISPQVQIEGPAVGSTFAVGDIFVLSGSATGGTNGAKMDDSTLTWEVRLVTENRNGSNGTDDYEVKSEVFLPPTVGNDVVLDGCPSPPSLNYASSKKNGNDDEQEQVYLEISLTATSTLGLTSTETMRMHPKMVDLIFETNPSGLYILLNGEITPTPAHVTTVEKHRFAIEAPSQRSKSGGVNGNGTTTAASTYVWLSWSDDGEQSHDYVALKRRNGKARTVTADFLRLMYEAPKSASVTGSSSEEDGSQNSGGTIGSTVFIAIGAFGVALTMLFVGMTMRRSGRRKAGSAGGGGSGGEEVQMMDETKDYSIEEEQIQIQLQPVDTLETKETKDDSVGTRDESEEEPLAASASAASCTSLAVGSYGRQEEEEPAPSLASRSSVSAPSSSASGPFDEEDQQQDLSQQSLASGPSDEEDEKNLTEIAHFL